MGKNIIAIEEAQKRREAKRAEYRKKEKVQRRLEKAREKKPPKLSGMKKLALVGVLAIALWIFISSGYRIIDLNLNKAVYEKKYEEKLAEKARLEKELSLIDDPEYVEQQARNRFHMLREGEILYVFPETETIEAQ